MALLTAVRNLAPARKLHRDSDVSPANTALTLTTPSGRPRKLIHCALQYSAGPTHSGAQVNMRLALGPLLLLDGSGANAQQYLYRPASELIIFDDDQFELVAPAGGAGITSTLAIYTEVL